MPACIPAAIHCRRISAAFESTGVAVVIPQASKPILAASFFMSSLHGDWEQVITFLSEPLDRSRERIAHVVPRLERVMKNNNGTVAGISADILKNAVGPKVTVVIAGYKVIHDDTVQLLDNLSLTPSHQAVGRAEKVTSNQVVGLGDVTCIGVK